MNPEMRREPAGRSGCPGEIASSQRPCGQFALLFLGLGGRRQWRGQRDLRDCFPGFASGFHGDLLVQILQFPESYGLGNGLVDVRAHARELVLVILELFPLIGERDWAERGCAGLDDLSHIIDNLRDWSGGRELRDLRRPIREGDGARRAYRRLHLRFRLSLLLRFLLCVFCHHLFHVRHLEAHFLSRFVCLSESCLGFLVRVLRVRKACEHECEEKQKRQEVRFHGADVSTAENAGANSMRRTKPSLSGLTEAGRIESGIQEPRKIPGGRAEIYCVWGEHAIF
jgi:hypothetical protein